jgi:hypothetical protein
MIDSKRHKVEISGQYLTVKIVGRGIGIPAKYTWPEHTCFIDSSLDEAYNTAAIWAESKYKTLLELMAADERVQRESEAREEAYKIKCRDLRLMGVKWGQQ